MLYDPSKEFKLEPELEPWRQILLDAAQYIRDHGWCQHRTCKPTGEVCLSTALTRACGDASPVAFGTARHRLEMEVGNIVHYNDSYMRRKTHVIDALERAAHKKEA